MYDPVEQLHLQQQLPAAAEVVGWVRSEVSGGELAIGLRLYLPTESSFIATKVLILVVVVVAVPQ